MTTTTNKLERLADKHQTPGRLSTAEEIREELRQRVDGDYQYAAPKYLNVKAADETNVETIEIKGNCSANPMFSIEIHDNRQPSSGTESAASPPVAITSGSKYRRIIRDVDDPTKHVVADVYSVTEGFAVTSGPVHHAIKKLLCPGQRGEKTLIQDLEEAKDAIQRAIELEKAWDVAMAVDEY